MTVAGIVVVVGGLPLLKVTAQLPVAGGFVMVRLDRLPHLYLVFVAGVMVWVVPTSVCT